MLSHVNHERMLDDTAAVKGTIAKVSVSDLYRILANINMADLWSVFCGDSFNDSLAPGMACGASHLKEKLMLRDVATRWNSTYDMLVFALQYQVPIDRVTSDKSLKRAKKIWIGRRWVENCGWPCRSSLRRSCLSYFIFLYLAYFDPPAIQEGYVVLLSGLSHYRSCDSSDGQTRQQAQSTDEGGISPCGYIGYAACEEQDGPLLEDYTSLANHLHKVLHPGLKLGYNLLNWIWNWPLTLNCRSGGYSRITVSSLLAIAQLQLPYICVHFNLCSFLSVLVVESILSPSLHFVRTCTRLAVLCLQVLLINQ